MTRTFEMCNIIAFSFILLTAVNQKVCATDYIAIDLTPSGVTYSEAYGSLIAYSKWAIEMDMQFFGAVLQIV
jgi:hypothetical protein